MSVRFNVIGRFGSVAAYAALACGIFACGESSAGNGGAGGQSTSGGTSNSGGGGAATGGGGMLGTGGSASGGKAGGGGAATGGASTGGSGGAATGGASTGGSGGAGGGVSTGGGGGTGGAGGKSKTTFFVTSDTSKTGKLGGLEGADKRCQDLAMKAGIGDHTFHAYLSTAAESAKDRIGKGPWVNAKGVTLAADLTALHASTLKGDPTLFIDESGKQIDGQWNSSPEADWSTGAKANQHDIFTGSKADGTVQAGSTCQDWTSEADADKGQVGHSDGMGPGMATTGNFSSWNASHASSSCATTWKAGGAGKLYCFAID